MEREIGTIIDCVGNAKDVYVIVTSREELFKEFERRKSSGKYIGRFERKLNILRPSYDQHRRKQILLNWSQKERCRWLGDREATALVLQAIESEATLPTPLSIRNFVLSSVKVVEMATLSKKLKEMSQDTERVFAKEIETMTRDKKLFLSFLFSRAVMDIRVFRKNYEELAHSLKLGNHWRFSKLLDWFRRDKVKVCRSSECEFVEFCHPSYLEAIKHLLALQFGENIFFKVLLNLSEKSVDDCNLYVASVLAENYDRLPGRVRVRLLSNLSKDKSGVVSAAFAATDNFEKLPEKVRNRLLNNLLHMSPEALKEALREGDVSWSVAYAVAENFREIPGSIRNPLLLRLAELEDAAPYVAVAIVRNFAKIPKHIRSLLFKLAEKDEDAEVLAEATEECFGRLPEKVRTPLLLKLSERGQCAWYVAETVRENFGDIPETIRTLLLLKLSKKDDSAPAVAQALAENFGKFPVSIRNSLLLNLSQRHRTDADEQASSYVADIVAKNYRKLPEHIQNILLKLSKRSETVEDFAWAVSVNYDTLPGNIRRLFLELCENSEAGSVAAEAVVLDFDKFPEDTRILLLSNRSSTDKNYF